jgi:hypothetical protein
LQVIARHALSAKALLEYLSTFLSAQAFDSLYCGNRVSNAGNDVTGLAVGLLAHTQSPLPSQTRTFKRLRWALQNKNRCPLRGSHDN